MSKGSKHVTKFYHAPRISHNQAGFYILELSGADSKTIILKENVK